MSDYIREAAMRVAQTRHQLIEAACYSALSTGEHGVIVVESADLFAPGSFEVEVSPLVPYGHICHFPSREAVAEWVRNGRPL